MITKDKTNTMLFTSNKSRSPRKVVFDSMKAQRYFLARLDYLTKKFGEDCATQFSQAVKTMRDEKINSEKELVTFYITQEDIQNCESSMHDHDCHAELGESGCTHWSHKEITN